MPSTSPLGGPVSSYRTICNRNLPKSPARSHSRHFISNLLGSLTRSQRKTFNIRRLVTTSRNHYTLRGRKPVHQQRCTFSSPKERARGIEY
ncbi:hypothetical protein NPIL_627071 [Nephila pilipes]|uniref:Uncharacterized protein n=1 Tax=Nephila pilipes TaxID=299642 RepID=A0A8X6URR1_NEPPI|nr:hypothetical protein NPIL_627071 [Nephila pilipes]